MKLTKLVLIVGLLVFPLAISSSLMASEKEALDAAKSWLSLVDQGKYEESWQEASTLFKRSVTVDQWKQAIGGARGMLGNVVERKFSSSEAHTSLPGVPDGQYIIILFKTTFEKKKHGLETITPMLDKDGTWRVSGYYMK